MDKTLLGLFILSLVLVCAWATHAVVMLTAIVGLSYLVVWGVWRLLQSFNTTHRPRRVLD
ncbi:MAG: hypothetical protein AAGF66_01190 [Cyanobacteria bacterium P01_H01_bin.119]